MYIDGKFVDASSRKTFNVYDPATEDVIATCPAGDAKDVDRAAQAAKKAFYGGWKATSAQERGRILLRLAERIRARRDALAKIETLNSGKPIVESEYDMDDSATCFEYYGGLATKINGEVIPVPTNAMVLAVKEPMGVAGQIIPWNYPLAMAAWKLGPALAAGCTVVIKPAEQTPLSLLDLAKDFEEIGLPPGVVNIVTGLGPDAGGPIVVHPDIRKIAFTGSAEVGKLIMRNASDQLKRVSLELGGKSPNIFFADADFEAAIDGARGILLNITGPSAMGLFEMNAAAEIIHGVAHQDANIIFGTVIDDEMGDEVKVTVIAAGFDRWDGAKSPLAGGPEAKTPTSTSNTLKDLFAEPAPDPLDDDDDDFDVPSFLK